MLKNLFKGISDFVVPAVCMSCGKHLIDKEIYVCKDCFLQLEKIHPAFDIIKYTFRETHLVNYAVSLFLFKEGTPIQDLIHGLKYEQTRNVGKFFGRMIGFEISKRIKENFDFIIPVPLHISKKRERTYNQSEYIAAGIAETLTIGTMDKCIKRVKYTETQTRLNREQRQQNVSGAFEIDPKCGDEIPGKNIILVDDVITTGATIIECARILKEEGAGKIMVCSIALAE
jgi:ComF family protein